MKKKNEFSERNLSSAAPTETFKEELSNESTLEIPIIPLLKNDHDSIESIDFYYKERRPLPLKNAKIVLDEPLKVKVKSKRN